MRVCLDLNVWVADVLSRRDGRQESACRSICNAVRGLDTGNRLQLVISWGMLDRLVLVLRVKLGFSREAAEELAEAIAGYADAGPSLTLGGVGVVAIHDSEDRHVLETALAGAAVALVTADFRGFLSAGAQPIAPDRLALLQRPRQSLHLIHPFTFAPWLRGETVPGFDPGRD